MLVQYTVSTNPRSVSTHLLYTAMVVIPCWVVRSGGKPEADWSGIDQPADTETSCCNFAPLLWPNRFTLTRSRTPSVLAQPQLSNSIDMNNNGSAVECLLDSNSIHGDLEKSIQNHNC